MRRLRILPIAALFATLIGTAARADWPAGGDSLLFFSYGPGEVGMASDAAGGVLSWWYIPEDYAWFDSHVFGDGAKDHSWPNTNNSDGLPTFGDGLGGLLRVGSYAAGSNRNLDLFKLPSRTGPDPAWPASGVVVASASGFLAWAAAHDGAGGAFVAYSTGYNLLLKRIVAAGTPAPGWPVAGLSIFTGDVPVSGPILRADGSGGVYLAWSPGLNGGVVVQRITSAGTIAPSWPAGGFAIAGGRNLTLLDMFPSGSDDWYIAWDGASVMLQRFHSDGTLSAGWPYGGIGVAPAGVNPSIIGDGTGGTAFAWLSDSAAVGVRILPSGVVASGWNPAGQPLLDASAPPIPYRPLLVPSELGGFIVLWDDSRDPGQYLVRARWLFSDGTPDAAQPDSGVVASARGTWGDLSAAMTDGNGGAFVAWVLSIPFEQESWAMMSHASYLVPAAVPVARSSSPLSLSSPWPNPARNELSVRFSLAANASARLTLLDIGGRRVRSQSVSGPGEHIQRFDRLGELAPGVYVLRLAQGSSVQTARVAILK